MLIGDAAAGKVGHADRLGDDVTEIAPPRQCCTLAARSGSAGEELAQQGLGDLGVSLVPEDRTHVLQEGERHVACILRSGRHRMQEPSVHTEAARPP